MSWFSSWDNFAKKAEEIAKSASEKATEAAKKAAEKSKNVASQVHDKVNKFVEEQKKDYNAMEQESDLSRRKSAKKKQMMESGHPPWHIDVNSHPQQQELGDELRINILKLCEDENNFLIKAPTSTSVFDFKLEYALPSAHAVLAEDPILPKIRFKLVPKKLTEEQFWKNYFYRVNVIRESLGIYKMDFSKPPIALSPRSRSPSGSKSEKNASNVVDQDTDKKDVNEESIGHDKETMEDKVSDKNEVNEEQKDMDIGSNGKDKDDKTEDVANKIETVEKKEVVKLEDNGIKMNLNSNLNKMPSSEQITEMPSDHGNDIDMDLNNDNDEFLSDDIHIDALTDEQRAKMKEELGIDGTNDVDNVDDLLAGVNTEDIDELSDGELAKELENI